MLTVIIGLALFPFSLFGLWLLVRTYRYMYENHDWFFWVVVSIILLVTVVPVIIFGGALWYHLMVGNI